MRKMHIIRVGLLLCSGAFLTLFPGCVEVYLLNLATPFLLY